MFFIKVKASSYLSSSPNSSLFSSPDLWHHHLPYHQTQKLSSLTMRGIHLLKKKEDEMGGIRVQRLSGMQKQVLSLYRGFLRATRSKSEEERRNIESVVKQEFRHNSKEVDRKNFQYIEYLLRRGNKQLDQLRNPGTTGLSSLQIDLSKIN